MMGDKVADAYASLIPEYGFRALVSMLEQACDRGIESVENAPDELVAFISAMEVTPTGSTWHCGRRCYMSASRSERYRPSPYAVPLSRPS